MGGWKSTWSAVRFGTGCSGCRCTSATGSSSARGPRNSSATGYVSVGREFPVFLHPQTHEEYALARLERKVAPGYRGFTTQFSPDVTLEEDLKRRDLTINAMARERRGRDHRSVRRAARSGSAAAAPCLGGFRRRPGAHSARGAVRRALADLGFRVADETLDADDTR